VLIKKQIMKTNRFLAIVFGSVLILNACAPLRTPVITKNDSIEKYKYIFIAPANDLTSSTGLNGSTYSVSSTKSVYTGDVITGILLKEGFIRLPELKPELAGETLIVNYGESGRRNRGLGYTIEITIQFISAKTHTLICSCTAEGQGDTEADDIRLAITRCLSGLLSK
jgi:hypothetical protein